MTTDPADTLLALDAQGREVFRLDGEPEPPVGPLRIRAYPYPHLSDDDGALVCRDYLNSGKLAFVIQAVAEAVARQAETDK